MSLQNLQDGKKVVEIDMLYLDAFVAAGEIEKEIENISKDVYGKSGILPSIKQKLTKRKNNPDFEITLKVNIAEDVDKRGNTDYDGRVNEDRLVDYLNEEKTRFESAIEKVYSSKSEQAYEESIEKESEYTLKVKRRGPVLIVGGIGGLTTIAALDLLTGNLGNITHHGLHAGWDIYTCYQFCSGLEAGAKSKKLRKKAEIYEKISEADIEYSID